MLIRPTQGILQTPARSTWPTNSSTYCSHWTAWTSSLDTLLLTILFKISVQYRFNFLKEKLPLQKVATEAWTSYRCLHTIRIPASTLRMKYSATRTRPIVLTFNSEEKSGKRSPSFWISPSVNTSNHLHLPFPRAIYGRKKLPFFDSTTSSKLIHSLQHSQSFQVEINTLFPNQQLYLPAG
jgi:hypothetical protein